MILTGIARDLRAARAAQTGEWWKAKSKAERDAIGTAGTLAAMNTVAYRPHAWAGVELPRSDLKAMRKGLKLLEAQGHIKLFGGGRITHVRLVRL